MARKFSPRKAIPWIHRTNPLVTSWVWETDHFVATIFSEGLGAGKKMFNWKINDKSSGASVPFESSASKDFNEAVEGLLEVIGKSYDRVLGYQEYSGDLATTFTVFTGQKIDLSPLIGETITLLIYNEHDELNDIMISGQFDISHYDIVLQADDQTTVKINPAYVKSIKKEYNLNEMIDELDKASKTASRGRRIFYEEWRKGCTGRPGFNPGTTEHSIGDPFCSIHNV